MEVNSMGVLENLEPEKVFRYFEEISQIPHGSGNIRQISDYLKKFAHDRGLACIQDDALNIIIIKEASKGYEQAAPLILQGHMDMVAVSSPGYDIDMTRDPLRLRIDNGRICAEGTSLGGDDGIAVAYALALLDADDIGHPRLEVVITVDEEVGLKGAHVIDLSMLKGKRLINLDQEEEGVIITSCAGGARVDIDIPVQSGDAPDKDDLSGKKTLHIGVRGLLGGHSGIEINKGRGNANCLLGRILHKLSGQFSVRLISMNGGQADNAIPRVADALIEVDITNIDKAAALVKEEENAIRRALGDADPDLLVVCEEKDETADQQAETTFCFDTGFTVRALDCLCELPNGVVAMSKELEGLVETSLNLGIVATDKEGLHLSYAVRSSVDEEREQLCGRLEKISARYGAKMNVRNAYPGWAYRADSPLRDIAVKVYEDIYGKKPVLEAIHAGVECGLLAAKIDGLDCISIGPDMSDVHTVEESLDIASVQRTWQYLLGIVAYRE